MISLSTNYELKWGFKDYPNYQITSCRQVINIKRGKIVKCTLNGGSIGWWIEGRFIVKSKVNELVELIKKEQTPF